MGKTLGAVLGAVEIAAGVALEFVPGGQAIGTSLIVSGVATEAGAIIQLLQSDHKSGIPETAIRSPVPNRVSGYGMMRAVPAFAL